MPSRPSNEKQDSIAAPNDLLAPQLHNETIIAESKASESPNYITGWRLHAITAGLCLGLLLVNFEVTVVSTALVPITNDLQDFARSSWIVTAYLITYTGCLVIWGRVSDLLGRKPACLGSFFLFAAFSGACGGAQTMVQLIVFRVIQGIGGSGIYGMTTIMLYELVPPSKFPLYTTYVMILFAIAFALGPVIGGLITNGGSWRWIFLLNVPSASAMGLLLSFSIPKHFPYHGNVTLPQATLKSFDFVGSLLTLAGVALLITGLEEAASFLEWRSARAIGPLCASGVAWALFITSQWYASRPTSTIQPVFPWRFCHNRVIIGLFVNTFMTGAVSVTSVMLIPLRYQAAAGLNPLQAGARLILFSGASAIGAIVAASLCKKKRVAPLYVILFGELLQILGLVLVTTLLTSASDRDEPELYGLQVCNGFGMGLVMGAATLLTLAIAERRDLSVASAAVVQFRFLGGAVVLSVTTAVGNIWIRNALSDLLNPQQLSGIFRSLETIDIFPDEVQNEVRGYFVYSFNLQMRILLGVAVAAVLSSFMMWQRPQIRVP